MRNTVQPIKIILANQYPLVRHTLKSIIEEVPEFELVAEINDRKDLIKLKITAPGMRRTKFLEGI